jgi:hypothetical protein
MRWPWMALAMPSPAGLGAMAFVAEPLENLYWGRAPSYAAALAETLALAWPTLILVALLAAGLAVWSWRRHQAYGAPYAVVWFLFVLVLGVPGLVGYLFYRAWPVRAACPSCGRETPRDREACLHCRTPFPQPAPLGIEVFG